MLKVLLKNPLTIWLQWLFLYFKVKRQSPTVKLYYNAFVRQAKLGKYVTVYDNSNIVQCEIGDYTYVAGQSVLLNTHVGNFCSIGPGVRCGLGRHPVNFVSTHPIFFSNLKQAQISFADASYFEEIIPIKIGNDVWIGANAIIFDGVKIDNGAIIAAGAVVNKDVPAYAIVGGVPAKIIKYRFSQTEIDYLMNFQWWHKEHNWIRDNWKLFHSIKEFTEHNSVG